jgi:uronate dehydrogenase
VSPQMPSRPDSLYAVSKCYGEALASFYHDRHGLESVCLRIGSCSPQPRNLRALNSWLSHADLCRLIRCAALAPQAGFAVVYGVSDNAEKWWHDDDAERIGYHPQDNSGRYRDALLDAAEPPGQPYSVWQGGKMYLRDYRKPETWT